METLNLLIIEDEETQLEAYNDAMESFSKKNAVQIEATICKNFKDGEQALLSPNYDAAIIDLKLSSSEELEGKILIEKVYQKIRIPIFVISGSISQIDDIPENIFLKKRVRTDLFTDVLCDILEIYNTGITSFLRPAGVIDAKLSEIFWNNLSSDLTLWMKNNNRNSLLRYILSHFQEHLEINLEGHFEHYHPSEVYIKPPIKKNIHTGDLIEFQGTKYIVLTPACDIVLQNTPGQQPTRNAESLTLAIAKKFDYRMICLNKKQELDRNKIDSYVKNKNQRYHYLPPTGEDTGFLVDFQNVTSIPYSEEMTRLATISSPFLKDIISRFAAYYSRQGQPTFNQDSIITMLYEKK